MRKICVFTLIVLIGLTVFGCSNTSPPDPAPGSAGKTEDVIYRNTEYGFTFSLPQNWKDYTIVSAQWEGRALGGAQDGKVTEKGALISIRHPEWSDQNPRQDIPIMVFSLSQWKLLEQGKISVGAAPIGPKELARDSKYVFALPARYNYAFPAGFEEVEEILAGNPLETQD